MSDNRFQLFYGRLGIENSILQLLTLDSGLLKKYEMKTLSLFSTVKNSIKFII